MRTLSCADFHWPEVHQLLRGDADIGNNEQKENVINIPHLLDWLFTEKTINPPLQKIDDIWGKKIMKI